MTVRAALQKRNAIVQPIRTTAFFIKLFAASVLRFALGYVIILVNFELFVMLKLRSLLCI